MRNFLLSLNNQIVVKKWGRIDFCQVIYANVIPGHILILVDARVLITF